MRRNIVEEAAERVRNDKSQQERVRSLNPDRDLSFERLAEDFLDMNMDEDHDYYE